MKCILSLAFIVSALVANSTVHTVSNNPQKPAQYKTITSAISVSNSGDTIYIHGSLASYDGFTLTGKKLAFIGPGFQPDRSSPNTATIHGSINLIGDLCSGSEFHGLVISASMGFDDCDGIKVYRNYFTPQREIYLSPSPFGKYRNMEFVGNYFYDTKIQGLYPISSILFQNNIFYYGNITGLFDGGNKIFSHNLFYGPPSGFNGCFGGCNKMVLENNIFIRRDPGSSNSKSKFYNNITFLASQNIPWLSGDNIDMGGNQDGESPQIVDQIKIEAGIFGLLLNYSIATGPAKNAGTNGKDIGLLFDPVGFNNWSRGRNSNLPFIYNIDIYNPIIEKGGNLSITIEARVNN